MGVPGQVWLTETTGSEAESWKRKGAGLTPENRKLCNFGVGKNRAPKPPEEGSEVMSEYTGLLQLEKRHQRPK